MMNYLMMMPKMMKTISNIKFFLFIFFITITTTAQYNDAADSLHWLQFKIPEEVLNYQFNQLQFEDQLFKNSILSQDIYDTSSVWIRTRMQLGTFHNDNRAEEIWKANILNPLQDKFIKSQQMKFWNTVLASVQVGAVSYLAYKHLRKYGFLKKK